MLWSYIWKWWVGGGGGGGRVWTMEMRERNGLANVNTTTKSIELPIKVRNIKGI